MLSIVDWTYDRKHGVEYTADEPSLIEKWLKAQVRDDAQLYSDIVEKAIAEEERLREDMLTYAEADRRLDELKVRA